jgi:hypothetical protein
VSYSSFSSTSGFWFPFDVHNVEHPANVGNSDRLSLLKSRSHRGFAPELSGDVRNLKAEILPVSASGASSSARFSHCSLPGCQGESCREA